MSLHSFLVMKSDLLSACCLFLEQFAKPTRMIGCINRQGYLLSRSFCMHMQYVISTNNA